MIFVPILINFNLIVQKRGLYLNIAKFYMICSENLIMMGSLVLLSARRLDSVKKILILEKFQEAQKLHLLKFLENKKKLPNSL